MKTFIHFLVRYKVQVLWGLFVCGMIFTLNYKPRDTSKEDCLKELKKYAALWTNGKVVRKFIDTKNHNAYIVEVSNTGSRTKTRFNLTSDHSILYDSLKIGYLVKKQAGSLEVYYGKGKLNHSAFIDLGCNTLN